jgi:hypothetical protein
MGFLETKFLENENEGRNNTSDIFLWQGNGFCFLNLIV